jgi:hypothetical protein
MLNGGYLSNNAARGTSVRYGKNSWLRRWEVDGARTGWAIVVKPEF